MRTLRDGIFVLGVVAALAIAACGSSDETDSAGILGTGVLTVAGAEYEFDVFTCTLQGYENNNIEFDFTVAGIGTSEGRTFHVHANRSYHSDTGLWIETVDLDYQDGDEVLRTENFIRDEEPAPFIFALAPDGLRIDDPVPFGRDYEGDTSAGPGTLMVDCTPPAE